MYCSQLEESFNERDVMDCYEYDEMRKQWREISKEEGKIPMGAKVLQSVVLDLYH